MSRQPTSMTADLPARPAPPTPLQPTSRHPPRNAIPPTPQPAPQPATKHTRAEDPRPSSPSDLYPPIPLSPPCRCSPLPPCCPLAPLPRSAPGPTKTSVMWWVEEGGPRVGAKRRGGDPLPQCQAQSQIPPRAGSRVSVSGVRLIDVHPNEHPHTPNGHPRRTPARIRQKGTTTQPLVPFHGRRWPAVGSDLSRTAAARRAYRAPAVSPRRSARTPAQATAPHRASQARPTLAPAWWQADAPILRATPQPCPRALPAIPHAPTKQRSPRTPAHRATPPRSSRQPGGRRRAVPSARQEGAPRQPRGRGGEREQGDKGHRSPLSRFRFQRWTLLSPHRQ
jgi:hypothetical protein